MFSWLSLHLTVIIMAERWLVPWVALLFCPFQPYFTFVEEIDNILDDNFLAVDRLQPSPDEPDPGRAHCVSVRYP